MRALAAHVSQPIGQHYRPHGRDPRPPVGRPPGRRPRRSLRCPFPPRPPPSQLALAVSARVAGAVAASTVGGGGCRTAAAAVARGGRGGAELHRGGAAAAPEPAVGVGVGAAARAQPRSHAVRPDDPPGRAHRRVRGAASLPAIGARHPRGRVGVDTVGRGGRAPSASGGDALGYVRCAPGPPRGDRRARRCRTEVRELWPDELPEALCDERVDVGLAVEVPPGGGLDVEPWRRQRVHLLVAEGHPFRGSCPCRSPSSARRPS